MLLRGDTWWEVKAQLLIVAALLLEKGAEIRVSGVVVVFGKQDMSTLSRHFGSLGAVVHAVSFVVSLLVHACSRVDAPVLLNVSLGLLNVLQIPEVASRALIETVTDLLQPANGTTVLRVGVAYLSKSLSLYPQLLSPFLIALLALPSEVRLRLLNPAGPKDELPVRHDCVTHLAVFAVCIEHCHPVFEVMGSHPLACTRSTNLSECRTRC